MFPLPSARFLIIANSGACFSSTLCGLLIIPAGFFSPRVLPDRTPHLNLGPAANISLRLGAFQLFISEG